MALKAIVCQQGVDWPSLVGANDSYYEEKAQTDHTWQEDWQAFENSLKTETRFFNEHAARHLESVFDGIEALKTRKGRTPIVDPYQGHDVIASVL